MPPYYPNQYPGQHQHQHQNVAPYYDQYNQYQYDTSQSNQAIPPYSRLQVNVPPAREIQQPSPQTQAQYHFQNQQAYQQNQQYLPQAYTVQPSPSQQQHQHQQHQYHQQIPIQYQQQYQSTPQPYVQAQQYYQPELPQPMPQIRQSQPQTPIPKPLQNAQPNVIRQPVPQTKPPGKPAPQNLPKLEPEIPEYDILLFTLADEYLEAAAKLSIRNDDYFKLTALALGCIEAVLNNFKLPPLREAQVRLRYAQLLCNETENNDEAEYVLTKTIELCDRLKYLDLKYGAQLLLTRVLHRSRPKAALKDLQERIQDAETYRHTAWEYAFRLQHVLFSMVSANDVHSAVLHLERIGHVARQQSDNVIYAFAGILESLVHLRSSNSDSISAATTAIAKARALQLNPEVSENPQMMILMEFVELCIHIKDSNTAQSEEKRKTMQKVLYQCLESPTWRADGLMYLPVNQSSLRGLQVQETGIVVERNRKFYLAFQWLPKEEVEDLGYLLSGVSAAHKNAGDGGKADRFFDEGLSMLREIMDEKTSVTHAGQAFITRRKITECHFLLEMAFLRCSKGSWNLVEQTIKEIETATQDLEDDLPISFTCLLTYLKGVMHQGRGELRAALGTFQSLVQNLNPHNTNTPSTAKPSTSSTKSDDTIRNISILAAMDIIFIIQSPTHPQHNRLQQMINNLDPVVNTNTNKHIKSAYNFLLANLPNSTILKTKQYLGHALNAAQSINNAQITTLCLVAMQQKFFKGVIGDQALKCARAATHQAKRLNEPLWITVAAGLESECLNTHGMTEDAWKRSDESERSYNSLPEKVKNKSGM